MKTYFFNLLLFIFSITAFCQETNTRGLVLQDGKNAHNSIKALIVGVSEYANYPKQSQLRYADNDAMAFAEFLKQHTSIEEENIHLLTNDQAFSLNVKNKLRQIFSTAEKDDLVIIYFAGHGDVDNDGEAYLITNDAVAPEEGGHDWGIEGAIEIDRLQKKISSNTSNKGFKVLLITDACRSGHITKTDNTNATINALMQDWNNTYKYVSCGPNQLSQEGSQWGGGHGAFTYYFLRGLMGEADQSGDKKILHAELGIYINSKVSMDTEFKQVPQYKGNASDILMEVDENLLDLVKQDNYNLLSGTVASRGNENKLESTASSLMKSFYEAIEADRILHPKYLPYTEQVDLKFLKGVQLGKVSHVAVTNEKVLVVRNGKTVEVFDNEKKIKNSFPLPNYPKMIGYEGNIFVFSDKNNSVHFYKGKEKIKSETYHKSEITSLKLSSNGKVFTGDAKGNIYSYSLSQNPKKEFRIKGSVTGIAITDPSDRIALRNEKGEVSILDADFSLISSSKLSPSNSQKMFFMNNGNLLLGLNYATVRSIHTSNGKTIKDYRLPKNEKPHKITKLNDNYLLVLGENSSLFFINVVENTVTPAIKHPMGKNFKWSSNSKVLASVSTSSVVNANVKVPIPFASEWYDKIQKDNSISSRERNDAKNTLAVALQYKAQKIMTPFVLGKSITPSAIEIKEAIYELNYANKLYRGDTELVEMVNLRRWFLQAYLIIVENNVKDFPLAISYLEKILKITPEAAYPYNGIALINQKLMKLEKTKETVAIAEKMKPTWTEPKKTMVNTYLTEENYHEALRKNEEIIKITPNGLKGYYGKANIYIKMGYYQKAWELVKKMEEINTNDPSVWETKLEVLLALGQLKYALALVNQNNSLNKISEKGYAVQSSFWTKIYDRQTQTVDKLILAEKTLLDGINVYPTSPELMAQLGKLYTEYDFVFKKSSKDVNAFLDKALILDPFNATALRYKAQYAIQIENNVSSAKNYTVKYTQKRGRFSDLDIFLGYVAYAQKDLEALASSAKTALLKNPYKLENYKLLWNTYVELNKEEELKELYLMGKDMLPDTPWFDYKYGLYFTGRKDYRKSASYIETALSISPDYNYAYVMKNPTVGIKKLYDYNSVKKKGAFYLVSNNTAQGLIDYAGRAVIPLEFVSVEVLKDGYTIGTTKEGKKQFTSPSGQLLGGQRYDLMERLECGLIKVQLNGKMGCIDAKSGKLVVPLKYDKITNGRWSGRPTACCRYSSSDSDQSADFYDEAGRCVSCD
ncbi:caspase family protein [Flammeovirga sp. EKP202]|uniref:caspase family protein n=1 Tax=Flammeovirga sp. EKP202 TaxID=2770592 RepID=UPI00165F5917|nr:caspase family protein [Flammeovirga sp. EKP202]